MNTTNAELNIELTTNITTSLTFGRAEHRRYFTAAEDSLNCKP